MKKFTTALFDTFNHQHRLDPNEKSGVVEKYQLIINVICNIKVSSKQPCFWLHGTGGIYMNIIQCLVYLWSLIFLTRLRLTILSDLFSVCKSIDKLTISFHMVSHIQRTQIKALWTINWQWKKAMNKYEELVRYSNCGAIEWKLEDNLFCHKAMTQIFSAIEAKLARILLRKLKIFLCCHV